VTEEARLEAALVRPELSNWYGTACGSKRVTPLKHPVATATGSVPNSSSRFFKQGLIS
jgi:hypothetical protein